MLIHVLLIVNSTCIEIYLKAQGQIFCVIKKYFLMLRKWNYFFTLRYTTQRSVVELWTHDHRVVSSNPVWAVCCVLEQDTLPCSSRPRCINGYQLRLGRLQTHCVDNWQLSHSNIILSSLAQLLVKRRLAPLDARRSVPTNYLYLTIEKFKMFGLVFEIYCTFIEVNEMLYQRLLWHAQWCSQCATYFSIISKFCSQNLYTSI